MLGPRCISLRPAVEAVAAPPTDTTLAIAAARVRVVTTTTIVIIPATRARDMGPRQVEEVLVVAPGEAIAIRRSPFVTYLRARRFTNFLVNEQNRVVFLRLCRFFCCCFLLLELYCNLDAHDTFVFCISGRRTYHPQATPSIYGTCHYNIVIVSIIIIDIFIDNIDIANTSCVQD